MSKNIVIALAVGAIVIIIGGAYYFYQSGVFNSDQSADTNTDTDANSAIDTGTDTNTGNNTNANQKSTSSGADANRVTASCNTSSAGLCVEYAGPVWWLDIFKTGCREHYSTNACPRASAYGGCRINESGNQATTWYYEASIEGVTIINETLLPEIISGCQEMNGTWITK